MKLNMGQCRSVCYLSFCSQHLYFALYDGKTADGEYDDEDIGHQSYLLQFGLIFGLSEAEDVMLDEVQDGEEEVDELGADPDEHVLYP